MKNVLRVKSNSPSHSKGILHDMYRNKNAYFLILPAVLVLIILVYLPIFNGFFKISMTDYMFYKESTFVGFKHYKAVLSDSFFWATFKNTLILGVGGLFILIIAKVLLAILINEVGSKWYKKLVQTVIYVPSLFSWVAIAGIWIGILKVDSGAVNQMLIKMGFEQVRFLTNESLIVPLYFFLNTWKNVGYGCIIMLAALTSVDPSLFEAAYIDGANRIKQIWHITLPTIMNIIKVVFLLDVIAVLRIFAPALVLSNPAVANKLEVVMVYIYRRGMEQLNFDYAAAAGYIVVFITIVSTFAAKKITRAREDD